VELIIDTHPHADHMSAAAYLSDRTASPTAIGERVSIVQHMWRERYDLPELAVDGRQWDRLLRHGDTITIGGVDLAVAYAPGHTLASIILHNEDVAFVNDTVFLPDVGTARADFPGGCAEELWQTICAIVAACAASRPGLSRCRPSRSRFLQPRRVSSLRRLTAIETLMKRSPATIALMKENTFMRGNARGPASETAPTRGRSAGRRHRNESRIEPGCDERAATIQNGEPERMIAKISEAHSRAGATPPDDDQEPRFDAEPGNHDDEEALWRKGIVAACLFCIVAVIYFALFSVMQVAQMPIHQHP
jgi:Metallo-beta-lactamase superfamily